MACSKMNLCRPAKSLGFSIVEPGRVEWGDMSDLTADEIFAASGSQNPDESGPAVADAMEWLLQALADGSVEAKELRKQATENSIAPAALKRAKGKMKITSDKEGFSGKWFWKLPDGATDDTAGGLPI